MCDEKCVLIVRHLPSQFSIDDKEAFLKHFGADRVRTFSHHGRMKHVAFASFADHEAAWSALQRLHQLELLGRHLSVEFSNSQMLKFHPSLCDPSANEVDAEKAKTPDTTKDERITNQKKEIVENLNVISSKWGFKYTYNPKLQYRYPAPSVAILTNIANALASVPHFYTQVLHLMNKMNIPAPFGTVTQTPPIPDGTRPLPQNQATENPARPVDDRNVSSGAESELDSGEDKVEADIQSHVFGYKRPARELLRPTKKHKLQKIVSASKPEGESETVLTTKDFFEQSQAPVARKIELKLPAAIAKSFNDLNPVCDDHLHQLDVPLYPTDHADAVAVHPVGDQMDFIATDTELNTDKTEESVEGGFGILQPVIQEQKAESSESEEELWGATKFISSKRLSRGRLSKSEMREMNVFKNYAPGDATPRLYIKNLAKQTTEKDLHYVFGKYVDWDNEQDKLMFDIRLMKEGRMKGQAFITLPNERNAKDALADTNSFMLNDKPLVVQFARSAKAKDA